MKKSEEQAADGGKIISNVEDKPCGCRMTTYSDKTQLYSPCVPCGLFATADHYNNAAVSLQQGAQALAAVATRLQQQQNAATAAQVSQAVRRVVEES